MEEGMQLPVQHCKPNNTGSVLLVERAGELLRVSRIFMQLCTVKSLFKSEGMLSRKWSFAYRAFVKAGVGGVNGSKRFGNPCQWVEGSL